jgi:hypothetical protein
MFKSRIMRWARHLESIGGKGKIIPDFDWISSREEIDWKS